MVLHGVLRPLARRHLAAGIRPLAVMSFDLIGSAIQVHGRWEGELLDLLGDYVQARADLAEGTMVDVGANIGTHALALAPHFAATLAFEPHPVMSQLLKINCRAAPSIEVLELALSDRVGEAELRSSADNQGGSSLTPAFGMAGQAAPQAVHRVACATLDSVLAERGGVDVSLVKIDIEGHEAAALRGMCETLARCSPVVVFEQAAGQFSEGRSPSIDLLREAGYNRFLVPVRNADLGPGLWRGALGGLVRCVVGTRMTLASVTRFEARDYDMILATKSD